MRRLHADTPVEAASRAASREVSRAASRALASVATTWRRLLLPECILSETPEHLTLMFPRGQRKIQTLFSKLPYFRKQFEVFVCGSESGSEKCN